MSVHLQVVAGLVIVIFMINIFMLVQNAMPSARGYQELLEDILKEKNVHLQQRAGDANDIIDIALAPQNNPPYKRKGFKEIKEGLALSLKRMRIQTMDMQGLVKNMATDLMKVQVDGNNGALRNMGRWQRRRNVPDSLRERYDGENFKENKERKRNHISIREDVLNEAKDDNVEEKESLLNKMDAAGIYINADEEYPIDQMNLGDGHYENQQQQNDNDVEIKHRQNQGENDGQIAINNGGNADLVINGDERFLDQGLQDPNFHLLNPPQNHQQLLRERGVVDENNRAGGPPVRNGKELNNDENLRALGPPQNIIINHQPINEDNIDENMKAHVPPVIDEDGNDRNLNLNQNNDQLPLPQRDIIIVDKNNNIDANVPPALQDNINNNNNKNNQHEQVLNPPENNNQLLINGENINGNINLNVPNDVRRDNNIDGNLFIQNPAQNGNHEQPLPNNHINANEPPALYNNNENLNVLNPPKHNDQPKEDDIDINMKAHMPPVLHENNLINDGNVNLQNPPLNDNQQPLKDGVVDENLNADVPPVLHENNVLNPPLNDNPQVHIDQHIDENLNANVPPVLHENNVLNPPLNDNPQAHIDQHIDENLNANVPPVLHENNMLNPPLNDNPQVHRDQQVDENLNANVPPVLHENNVLNPPLHDNPQVHRDQQVDENLNANVPPVLHEKNVLNPPLIDNPQVHRDQHNNNMDENLNANAPQVLHDNPQAPKEHHIDENLQANEAPVLHDNDMLNPPVNANPQAPIDHVINENINANEPPDLRDNNVNNNKTIKPLNLPQNNKPQDLNENAQMLNQVHDQQLAGIKDGERMNEVVPPVLQQGNEEPDNNGILRFENEDQKHGNVLQENQIYNQERNIPNAVNQQQELLVPNDNQLNDVQRPLEDGEPKANNINGKEDM